MSAFGAVEFYFIEKRVDHNQVSSAIPVPGLVVRDPTGYYHFEVGVEGEGLANLSPAPTFQPVGGALTTLAYVQGNWKLPPALAGKFLSKTTMDTTWPNGSFTLSIPGRSYTFRLSAAVGNMADAYPNNIPQVVSGGTWSEGKLRIPVTGTTLTFNSFPEFASGGHMGVKVYGRDANGKLDHSSTQERLSSQNPEELRTFAFNSSVPLFAAGKRYYVELGYLRIVDSDTAAAPALGVAAFRSLTAFEVEVVATSSVAPVLTAAPGAQVGTVGGSATFSLAVSDAAATVQWERNGVQVPGATATTLTVPALSVESPGIYSASVTNSSGTTTAANMLGLTISERVVGAGTLVGSNITHPNGNRFDQVLATGTAEALTADTANNRVMRTSFIDLNDDIVQVEFSGAGTLSLVLENPTGPAGPAKYNQAVSYMKGRAAIVIVGANETTHVSVFSVGRATAFDPTGAYNILQAPSTTNDPARNGSSLFVGHQNTVYDGVADVAFIAIASTNGKFGGVRASNARFGGTRGRVGVFAPGVALQGPLFIGDIDAAETATPVIEVGSVNDARITGGDLLQTNSRAVEVNGLTQLRFTAGVTSSGTALAAQTNRAILRRDGADVTTQIVVNP